MRTGVSYMGHHRPRYIHVDLTEMKELGCDDVLLAAQEVDFIHFTGKIQFVPKIAKDIGLRPIAIFWGVLNLFGGGRSSQFLLENPEGFQKAKDGSHRAAGCFVNPVCVNQIQKMIDRIAELGFEGYFIDEPTPLKNCYCKACQAQFKEWYKADLLFSKDDSLIEKFRKRCVVNYVLKISEYCQKNHPKLETFCCVMPRDKAVWGEISEINGLTNIGTDIYWVNDKNPVEEMIPMVREIAALCKEKKKKHHEWLQCWDVRKGQEDRILGQGQILVNEKPDGLYIWAWQGQIGTYETCDDPNLAWEKAARILRMAKGLN